MDRAGVQFLAALALLLVPGLASAQVMAGNTSASTSSTCPITLLQNETLGPPGKTKLAVTVQPETAGQMRLMYGTSLTTMTTEIQPQICDNLPGGTCTTPGVAYTVAANELVTFKMGIAPALTPNTKYYYQVQCRTSASNPWAGRAPRFAWTGPNAGSTYEVYGWGDEQNAHTWGCNLDAPPEAGSRDYSYQQSTDLVMDWTLDSTVPSFFLSLGDTFQLAQYSQGAIASNMYCTGGAGAKVPCQWFGQDVAAGRNNAVATTCSVMDDSGGANAAGNETRGEAAMQMMLRATDPIPAYLSTWWVPGNWDLDMAQDEFELTVGGQVGQYPVGTQQDANDTKRKVLFNPQEANFYPGAAFNDTLGREFCTELGDAIWCVISPYTCTCAVDCEPADTEGNNLPQDEDDWVFCANSKTEIDSQIDAFAAGGGKYAFIVSHQGAWGVNGISRTDRNYGRGGSLAVTRRCYDASVSEAPFGTPSDGGAFQCQDYTQNLIGTTSCVTEFGSDHQCAPLNPEDLGNNADAQWLQTTLEGFIAAGGDWAFWLSGHDHADHVNCKLNSSGVCSKVVYAQLGMPTIQDAGSTRWGWTSGYYAHEYFDADKDGRADHITFWDWSIAGDLTTGLPHGPNTGSNVAGAWKIIVSSADVTFEKWSIEDQWDEITGSTTAPNSKIIDLTFATTRTPISVALACVLDGADYDCTATPSNAAGSVEYLADCDGDWLFNDESVAVKGSQPHGWHTTNTFTCPSGDYRAGGEIHVVAEELGGPLLATGTFPVPP